MENLLERDQVELEITIDETVISCEYGELEYSFDDDYASVNAISVSYSRTREGIGTQLVNRLETIALENGIKLIEVPCSPTREAILFWISVGYSPTTKEERQWVRKISNSYREERWDTPSGVVVMSKKLE